MAECCVSPCNALSPVKETFESKLIKAIDAGNSSYLLSLSAADITTALAVKITSHSFFRTSNNQTLSFFEYIAKKQKGDLLVALKQNHAWATAVQEYEQQRAEQQVRQEIGDDAMPLTAIKYKKD